MNVAIIFIVYHSYKGLILQNSVECQIDSLQDDQGVAEIELPKPFSGYRDFVYVDEDQEFQVNLSGSALLVFAAAALSRSFL